VILTYIFLNDHLYGTMLVRPVASLENVTEGRRAVAIDAVPMVKYMVKAWRP
jgi:hypothetical protein